MGLLSKTASMLHRDRIKATGFLFYFLKYVGKKCLVPDNAHRLGWRSHILSSRGVNGCKGFVILLRISRLAF